VAEAAKTTTDPGTPEVIGRYALFGELASGGMATVHLGRLLGPVGFSRTVAIKKLHPQFAKDPEFVTMFLEEARLVSRIRHPNVVPTLDVVSSKSGLFLVMEYVHGESLARIFKLLKAQKARMPDRIASAVLSNLLLGLHAAHESKSETGENLGIVHRDVSPQNVLVGVDGVARVLDFGIARAQTRVQTTRNGELKGKLSYMSPEQVNGITDRRTDVYAASIVLWELITGERLFEGDNDGVILRKVLTTEIRDPREIAPELSEALSAVVMKGLSHEPDGRFPTARAMALELEKACAPASPSEVGEWLQDIAHESLDARTQRLAVMDRSSRDLAPLNSSYPPPSLVPLADKTPAGVAADSEGEGARARRRNFGIAIAFASLGIFAGAAGLVLHSGGAKEAAHDNPAIAVETAPATPPASIEEKEDASAESQPSTPAAPPTVVSPPPVAPASPTPPRGGGKRGPKGGAAIGVSAGAPPTTIKSTRDANKCDPPYTIDSAGRKHYKPECLN